MKAHKSFYIANCIERAMRAGSDDKHHRRLIEDIAEAVLIADADSLDAAHKHLMIVCDAAESGLYFTKEKTANEN